MEQLPNNHNQQIRNVEAAQVFETNASFPEIPVTPEALQADEEARSLETDKKGLNTMFEDMITGRDNDSIIGRFTEFQKKSEGKPSRWRAMLAELAYDAYARMMKIKQIRVKIDGGAGASQPVTREQLEAMGVDPVRLAEIEEDPDKYLAQKDAHRPK